MNNNSKQPAFPTFGSASDENPKIIIPQDYGLSKREYMATKFLASLIVHEHSPVHDGTDYLPTISDLCGDAVRYADRLLEELESKEEVIEGEKLGEMNHLKEPDTER